MATIAEPRATHEIAAYYDTTLERRLRDYVFGNERIAAAIELVGAACTPATRKVLDVGCGLGIAADALTRKNARLTVHAVDISPKTIETAERLFGHERLVFEVSDMREVPRLAPYDVITLLDVSEHIPREGRPGLHAVLGQALAPQGTLVLTTPSPLHQEYLARTDPGGLQIVDETIWPEDFLALARDVGGTLVCYRSVSIWKTHDYCHVVIQRNPTYGSVPWPQERRPLWRRAAGWLAARRARWAERRAAAARQARVRARLGISVSPPTGVDP
jgi:protein-L-isoaspartate O-methyltransferase